MQIERLAKDPEYALKQFERGGAYFQLLAEGGFTPAQVAEYARAIVNDLGYIISKRPPLSPSFAKLFREIEKQAPADMELPAAFMLGVGQERARRNGRKEANA